MEKTYDSVWKKCLQIISDNVSAQSFKTWFEPIKPIKLDEKILTIEVPSQFFYEWLEEHYITLLRKTIRQQLGTDGRLEYSIVMEHAQADSKPYTVKIPTRGHGDLRNNPVNVPMTSGNNTIRNPFIIPGLKEGEC